MGSNIQLHNIITKALIYVIDSFTTLDKIMQLPNCNDCEIKDCQYRPEWGEPIRYNCPFRNE